MKRRNPNKPLLRWRGHPLMTREQYDRNLTALLYLCSVAIRVFGTGKNAPIQINFPSQNKLRTLLPNGLPGPNGIDDSLFYRKPTRPKTEARSSARRRRQMGV